MNFSIFNSELKPRRWFRLALGALACMLGTVVALNLLVDPYDYVGASPLPLQIQTNERLWKTDYLDAHHERFDSYILGSSIASQIDPALAGELTGGRFYNLTVSGANTYDFELCLRYMLEQRYEIRRLLLVFDLSVFWSYGESGREYERNHPAVSGDSALEFYASYLTHVHFWGTLDKIRLNLGQAHESPHSTYDRSLGVYRYGHKNALIVRDHEAFLRESRTLNENYLLRTRRPDEPFAQAMAAMARLRDLCRRNGIELTVLVPPHNYNYMNRIVFEQYAGYLESLAAGGEFWDFSGYGEINLDNHHFFDSMHFRPHIGERILRRMWGGAGEESFGVRVTRDTIAAHLLDKRAEFERADARFPSYEDRRR